jgi:probable HAF family extracellular repeat protein
MRWTAATGIIGLGDLPGGTFSSSARSVSRDGSVVVGQGTTSAGQQAFRWTQAGGMLGLGLLPGTTRSLATSTNAVGDVVVGAAFAGSARTAFIWTPAHGMRPLKDVLLEQGAPVLDWNIEWAADISADGKTIIGTAEIPGLGSDVGWLAMLP